MFKFISEIGPLLVFFLAYHYAGLMVATLWLAGTTIITTALLYATQRQISYIPLCSALLLSFFAGLSWFSGDVTYIKMKPTFINLLFAAILFGGAICKRGLLKYVMGEKLPLTDHAWIILSLRWAIFFCLLAILNECIWRSLPETIWVKFKVFGILTLSLIFMLSQVPFMQKNRLPE